MPRKKYRMNPKEPQDYVDEKIFQDFRKAISMYSNNNWREMLFDMLSIHNPNVRSTDVRYSNGTTPLMDAFYKGNYEAANILLEHGADPNLVDYNNKNIIWYIIQGLSINFFNPVKTSKAIESIEEIFKRIPNIAELINARRGDRYNGQPILYYFLTFIGRANFLDSLRLLIKYGADINLNVNVGRGPSETFIFHLLNHLMKNPELLKNEEILSFLNEIYILSESKPDVDDYNLPDHIREHLRLLSKLSELINKRDRKGLLKEVKDDDSLFHIAMDTARIIDNNKPENEVESARQFVEITLSYGVDEDDEDEQNKISTMDDEKEIDLTKAAVDHFYENPRVNEVNVRQRGILESIKAAVKPRSTNKIMSKLMGRKRSVKRRISKRKSAKRSVKRKNSRKKSIRKSARKYARKNRVIRKSNRKTRKH